MAKRKLESNVKTEEFAATSVNHSAGQTHPLRTISLPENFACCICSPTGVLFLDFRSPVSLLSRSISDFVFCGECCETVVLCVVGNAKLMPEQLGYVLTSVLAQESPSFVYR